MIHKSDALKKIELGLSNSYNIDSNEKAVINALSMNARKTLVELSREIGLSIPTIKSIMRDLEKKSIIKAYTTNFDYSLFGLDHYKLLISVKEYESIPSLKAFLELQPEVIQIQLLLNADLELELYVDSVTQLEEFIGRLTTKNQYIKEISIIPVTHESRKYL